MKRCGLSPRCGLQKAALAFISYLLIIVGPSPVQAQSGYNVQLFRPSPFYGPGITVHPSGRGSLLTTNHKATWRYQAAFYLNYQNDALISSTNTNTLGQNPSSSDLLSLDILAAIEFFDWLSLGIDVPLHPLGFDFTFSSTTGFDLLAEREIFVMGDISTAIRVSLLSENDHGIGLGLVGTILFPTGEEEKFLGDSGVQGGATLALQKRIWLLNTAMNLGYETRDRVQHFNLDLDDRFTYGAAASFAILSDFHALAELRGSTSVQEFWQGTEHSPLELLIAGRFLSVSGFAATLGVGFGLIDGVGTSDVRVLAGVQYNPWIREELGKDTDRDGIVDRYDACIEEPEDFDGVLDRDGCPEDYTLRIIVRDKNGKALKGLVTIDPGHIDPLGVSGDRLAAVPQPGKYIVEVSAEGYHSAKKQVVVEPDDYQVDLYTTLTPARFKKPDVPLISEVHRKLTSQFAFDSSTVPESFKTGLDRIINYLKEHQEILKVRLEGHADAVGSEVYNLELSKRRAQAVKDYFVAAGIAEERIQVWGLGETNPLASNSSKEGRQLNRRVEILVMEKDPTTL